MSSATAAAAAAAGGGGGGGGGRNSISNVTFLENSRNSTNSGDDNRPNAIHVFPPNEIQQQRNQQEQQKKSSSSSASSISMNNKKGGSRNSVSAAASSSSSSFASTNSYSSGSGNKTTAASLLPLSHISLQTLVDHAADGDCIYIQPGTHELHAPLYVSEKKKIYIIGFVESHTDSNPPTLKMKVTRSTTITSSHQQQQQQEQHASFTVQEQERLRGEKKKNKKSENYDDGEEDDEDNDGQKFPLSSQLLKGRNPLKPMIRVQQGSEVFISHMRFEYVVEIPVSSYAYGLNLDSTSSDDEDLEDASNVGVSASGSGENLDGSGINSNNNNNNNHSSFSSASSFSLATASASSSSLRGELSKSPKKKSNSKKRSKKLKKSNESTNDLFVYREEAFQDGDNNNQDDEDEEDEEDEEAILLQKHEKMVATSEQQRFEREQRKRAQQEAKKQRIADRLLAERRRQQLIKDLGPLPLGACVIEVTGAGTQVTMNHCTFLSQGHGIVFKCTAVNVGANRTIVASPRLACRDQCVFQCEHGTAIVIESQGETGFANASKNDAMVSSLSASSSMNDALKPPEGIVHVTKAAFASSLCGIEASGPIHLKISDSDFESCKMGVSAQASIRMHVSVSESLFQKCEMGVLIDAPRGAGSSRDISLNDSRFDFCERGLVVLGEDSAISCDSAVFTRCGASGVLIDGGGRSASSSSFLNSIFQQNEIGVEIIDGRPLFVNNTFHGNVAAAVIVSGSGTTPTFKENTFTNTGASEAAGGARGSGNGGGSTVSMKNRLNARTELDTEQEEEQELKRQEQEEELRKQKEEDEQEEQDRSIGGDYLAEREKKYRKEKQQQMLALSGYESGTSVRSGSSSLNAHRRSVRCAAFYVEHEATPLVEYNRFENNYGANILIVSGLGVFTDNALGIPSTDSYNIVVSGPKSNPKIHFNCIFGNERGQARPALVVEDGSSADIQLNDFVKGQSSAIVLRRTGKETVVAQNRVAPNFLEGIVVMEKAQGIAQRNNMKGLSLEIFSDSRESFRVL